MPGEPVLSVVVPTRNEAENVTALVGQLRAVLGGTPHELCFVDDSDDATPAALEALERDHPGEVRAMLRRGDERQGGLSTAVADGLRMARGEYVCVMDADLQHPPETITAMLEAARSGADLVVASRYTGGGAASGLEGATRRLVSRGATWLARLLFVEARRSTDPLSGFFLCRRALVDGIEFRPVGFKILLELLVCVPGVTVVDVPLRFQPRAHGESKASLGQGLLYLRHVRSLVLDVRGSARPLKFALVGISGLLVFLPVVWLLGSVAHWHPLLAFVPAFAVSLAWNTALNRLWTFSDLRRRSGGAGPLAYLERALVSGAVMFAAFAVLEQVLHLPLLVAALLAALVAMAVNGLSNLASVRRGQASPWSRVAADRGVQQGLEQLAAQLGADRAYVVPAPVPASAHTAVPPELLQRAVRTMRPALWTEAPSHRPQRRTNIDSASALVVPVVGGDGAVAVVVCERRRPQGFEDAALELATAAVDALRPLVLEAAGGRDGTGASPSPRPAPGSARQPT